MTTSNRAASEAMVAVGVSAATDVTGFGLAGHLLEMLDDDLGADIDFDSVPILLEAIELAGAGVLPGGSKRNRDAMGDRVSTGDLDEARRAVLFDAQTSGGLLIAIDPNKTEALHVAMAERGVTSATTIGKIVEGSGGIDVSGG
jgi:selenide,water dikinase